MTTSAPFLYRNHSLLFREGLWPRDCGSLSEWVTQGPVLLLDLWKRTPLTGTPYCGTLPSGLRREGYPSAERRLLPRLDGNRSRSSVWVSQCGGGCFLTHCTSPSSTLTNPFQRGDLSSPVKFIWGETDERGHPKKEHRAVRGGGLQWRGGLPGTPL